MAEDTHLSTKLKLLEKVPFFTRSLYFRFLVSNLYPNAKSPFLDFINCKFIIPDYTHSFTKDSWLREISLNNRRGYFVWLQELPYNFLNILFYFFKRSKD